MGILSFEEYKDRSREIIEVPFVGSFAAGAALNNAWVTMGGAIPSAAALCDDLLLGAIGERDRFRFTEDYYLLGLEHFSQSWAGGFSLVDRLAHQGGLDASLSSEQTTNLPLGGGITRYDPAVDRIQAGVHIYVQIGATATTMTARYTNSANVANQVSQPIVIGGTGNLAISRFLEIPPADGHRFKTIEGVTLAGSTGTVGNFGITLFHKLIEGYSRPWGHGGHYGINLHSWHTGDMDLPVVKAGACLNLLGRFGNTGAFRGVVRLMRVN